MDRRIDVSECWTESQMIRVVGGQAPEHEQTRLARHVSECAACAERLRSLQATWDALGEWSVQPPDRDLAPEVLAAIQRRQRVNWPGALRIAASVALAAGIGTGAALLTPMRGPAPGTPPDSEELLQIIGADALVSDAPLMSDVFASGGEGSGEGPGEEQS